MFTLKSKIFHSMIFFSCLLLLLMTSLLLPGRSIGALQSQSAQTPVAYLPIVFNGPTSTSQTSTSTSTPTNTPTGCPTDTVPVSDGCATVTPTPTNTPTSTHTATSTACPTDTVAIGGSCATVTSTPTNTPTATSTDTPTPTSTPTTTPTATSTDTPTPSAATLDGLWKGTTSQNKELSFRVSNHGFQFMSVDYFFDFGSCSISGPVSFFQATPIPFNGNTFSVAVTSRTSTAGKFTSGTMASGTLQVQVNEFGCSGTGNATWNATKQ